MKPVIELDGARVYLGDCRKVLRELPDNSVDSIVTDPPYGLSNTTPELVSKAVVRWISGERDFIPDGKGFMGKDWDSFVPPPAVWDECLRVLKRGGHLLAFFGSRTMDLGQLSIRLAGFEIRDNIAWMYGSGFPKSLDVSKAIDKRAGAEREVSGITRGAGIGNGSTFTDDNWKGIGRDHYERFDVPASEEAEKWQGWGTALKPAFEPIVVGRKPLVGNVAENVLAWGTGGLNIDGSRIGSGGGTFKASKPDGKSNGIYGEGINGAVKIGSRNAGRWPANVILDEVTAELLDEQSGVTKSRPTESGGYLGNSLALGGSRVKASGSKHDDSGGASRFFYVAKASKRDRNEGLEELEAQRHSDRHKDDGVGGDNPRNRTNQPRQNFHPTVKPTALMRYLVKLVTPSQGTVLDPFTGSGSTGKAALIENFNFIGVEITEEYLPIIEGRLKWALDHKNTDTLF